MLSSAFWGTGSEKEKSAKNLDQQRFSNKDTKKSKVI